VVLMGCSATQSLVRIVRHGDDSQRWTSKLFFPFGVEDVYESSRERRDEVEEYALG